MAREAGVNGAGAGEKRCVSDPSLSPAALPQPPARGLVRPPRHGRRVRAALLLLVSRAQVLKGRRGGGAATCAFRAKLAQHLLPPAPTRRRDAGRRTAKDPRRRVKSDPVVRGWLRLGDRAPRTARWPDTAVARW